jgi:hypothetical protein
MLATTKFVVWEVYPVSIDLSDRLAYPVKTPVAAHLVGANATHLHSLLRRGAILSPRKDSSGDYLWSPSDIAAAVAVIARIRGQQSLVTH